MLPCLQHRIGKFILAAVVGLILFCTLERSPRNESSRIKKKASPIVQTSLASLVDDVEHAATLDNTDDSTWIHVERPSDAMTCHKACAQKNAACDILAMKALDMERKVHAAFANAGLTCKSIVAKNSWGYAVPIIYNGVCEFPLKAQSGENACQFGHQGADAQICACHQYGKWMTATGPPLKPIQPGDLVFDCGASFGPVTETFMNENKARVVTVEANRAWITDHILPKVQKSHDPTLSVALVNAALADKDGEITFYVSCNPYLSSTRKEWLDGSSMRYSNIKKDDNSDCPITPVLTQTRSLDSLIKQFGAPVFIKIDVEGAEEIALHGLTSKGLVPMISWEWTYPDTFSDALRMVRRAREDLGFVSWSIRYLDQPWNFIPTASNFFCLADIDEKLLRVVMSSGPVTVGMFFVSTILPDGAIISQKSACQQ